MDTADDLRLTHTINDVLSKKLLAILTGKDAIPKEVRYRVIRNNEERLEDISPYIYYYYWRDMGVKNGCLCIDKRIAIPKSIKVNLLEDFHFTHPGSFSMHSLAQNTWWPYIHRDILAKVSECKVCTEISKNLKAVISHSERSPLPNCIEPNDKSK